MTTERTVKQATSSATRTFVLDTSVLLSDPRAVLRFDEHDVVVPLVVVTELEGKRHHPELGYFARQALRLLDDLRTEHGRLDERYRSATQKSRSRDWLRLSLGSHAVSYRWRRSASAMCWPPPMHSVTSSPVNSMWMPPGCVPSARCTSKKPCTSSTIRSKCRVL